jgi:AraC-like DNA-binding protein
MRMVVGETNKEKMQKVLDCFVELTGIRAAFFDDDQELVNGKNKDICDFCRQIRNYPDLYIGCMASDREAVKTAGGKRKTHLYRCHMGLWEAVIPIFISDIFAGYLMLGQIIGKDNKQGQWLEIEIKLRSWRIKDEELARIKSAYDEVVVLELDKIQAAVEMLRYIAEYIVETSVVQLYGADAVKKTKNIIEEKILERISIKEIAKIVGLSPSYLGFLFKRETGMPITRYIENIRVSRAGKLLQISDLSISEVAQRSGYEDVNYFSRIFKKTEGVSPSAYRKKYR